MNKFKIGDRVKIEYITDCNKHNGKIGIITNLRSYNYYPNGDCTVVETKTNGVITYSDGTTEEILDFYREGNGLVSSVIKIE